MTRKDYTAFAAAFKARLDSGSAYWTVRDLAHDAANIFAADNGRFDRSRFLAACGLDDYAPCTLIPCNGCAARPIIAAEEAADEVAAHELYVNQRANERSLCSGAQ